MRSGYEVEGVAGLDVAEGRVLRVAQPERSCYFLPVSKGEETRRQVLEAAVEVAASGGLAALTIGSLADRTGMSKSGLFAHFKSKEALQVQVLEFASEAFVDDVVRPALSAPRGEKRITTLFESWLAISREGTAECLFVSAAWEYDDQPGPVRDRLVRMHLDFNDSVAQMFRTGVSEGFFASGADPEQFTHDLHGIMLIYFQAHRLLGDARAEERARHAFARLIESNR
jgi:AcrR family transcriptional regulator